MTPEDANVWIANYATQVRRGGDVSTYQVIDVTDESLVYRPYLAETSADPTSHRDVGAIFDECAVTKTADGQKWVIEARVELPR